MLSILMIATLAFVVIVNGITRFAFTQITQMKLQNNNIIYSNLEKAGVFSREQFDNLIKRQVGVMSIDGLRLSGYVLEPYPQSKRWVIIVHGYTVSLLASTQYIDIFEKKGFNILLIDQRRHGNSEGKFTTYGYMEKYDIECWVNWLTDHYGINLEIGLHGQSFGGATVLEYLSIAAPNVKFVVADCPYSDLTELLRHQIKVLNKIPCSSLLLPLVNIQMKQRAGFRMQQVSPLRCVRTSAIPLLLIHGTSDNYVPTHMGQSIYEHKYGPKKLLLVEGASHADAYAINPQQYTAAVHELIDEVLDAEEILPIEEITSPNNACAYLTSI